MTTIRSLVTLAAVALAAFAPKAASAQQTLNGETTLYACYVPKSGTVYRIKVEGTPTKCAQNHVQFSWTTGGASSVQVFEHGRVTIGLLGGESVQQEIACPAGSTPVSGGFDADPTIVVDRSISYSLDPTKWSFRARNTAPFSGSTANWVTFSVNCITI